MFTDDALNQLTPTQKRWKTKTDQGLYVEVYPNGARCWRFRFKLGGVDSTIGFGVWPAVSVTRAYSLAARARQCVKDGREPQEELAAELQSPEALAVSAFKETFRALAEDWLEDRAGVMRWSADHKTKVSQSLVNHVFDMIGDKRIRNITPQDVLAVIRKVEASGATDMAIDVRSRLSMIFRFGIATGRAQFDHAHAIKDLCVKHDAENLPALPAADLPVLFARMRGFQIHPHTYLGIRLHIVTCLRPGWELRAALWSEILWDSAVWRVPAARMKLHKDAGDHFVPLCPFAMETLRELRYHTGDCRKGHQHWIFPSAFRTKDQPVSDSTWRLALNDMGYFNIASMHGFRATFATAGNNHKPGVWRDPIDVQLDHETPTESQEARANAAVSKTYNRAAYEETRFEILNWWGARVAAQFEAAKALPMDAPIIIRQPGDAFLNRQSVMQQSAQP